MSSQTSHNRLFVHGLIGFWVGALFSLVHLFLLGADNIGPLLLLGDFGVTSITGFLIGIILGYTLQFVPPRLRVSAIIHGVRIRLAPDAAKALQFRCKTVSTCWSVGFFVITLNYLLSSFFAGMLGRIQAPFFGAAIITFGGILILSLVFLISGLLRSALGRALEVTIRRFNWLSPLCHPLGTSILVTTLVSAQVFLWLTQQSTQSKALVMPYLPFLALVLITVGLGDGALPYASRLNTNRLKMMFLGTALMGSIASGAGLRSEQVQQRLSVGYAIPSSLMRVLQKSSDEDGDGYSGKFGGRDCNDQNPFIHPDAPEIDGNRIDENCDGSLISATVTQSKMLKQKSLDVIRWPARPNILLITVSNLKPSHLSFFGYQRETTPKLDAHLSESVYFTQAYTASPTMDYGLASLLTGLYPSELKRTHKELPIFSAQNPFLAKDLSALGYETSAFLSHWYFGEGTGFQSGFKTFSPRVAERGRTAEVATAGPLVDRFLNSLKGMDVKRPYFTWLHMLDPAPKYLEHLNVPRFGRNIIAQYDHELKYVDEQLDRLISALKQRDDWWKTVLIVTSEQGANLAKNIGRPTPGKLAQAVQKVPLFIRIPGIRARPIDAPVSATQIAQTVVELALKGQRSNETPLNSLLRFLQRTSVEESQPILTELLTARNDQFSLSFIEKEQKLVYDGEQRGWRLYNLSTDPDEKVDMYAMEPERANEMRKSLARFRSNMKMVAPE